MKRIAVLLLLALSLTGAFAADATDSVREAWSGWTQGAVKQDKAALERFMADDLQYAHSGGNVETKQKYIASVTTGPARYESLTLSDEQIRFYGNVAVLTGHTDVKMVNRDPFRVRTLQVYTKKDGQWQMAAHQSTRVGR
jgi:ketosteroid isomerase-like protein